MDSHADDPIRRSHPQNADGPFYVRNGECMACGAPELEAPSMMAHDREGHCFFARQPNTAEETTAAILGTWASCCGAVRYAGRDSKVLTRLAEIGSAECCDHRLDNEPKPADRNYVSFEFVQPETSMTESSLRLEIMKYFASSLKYPGSGRVSDFQFSHHASFRYERGTGPKIYGVTFTLELRSGSNWLLRILRDDHHPSTAFAITIHKALEHDSRFRRSRWFSEQEWLENSAAGLPRPY
jgi:hypothetical protein